MLGKEVATKAVVSNSDLVLPKKKSTITCWVERLLLQPQVERVPQGHQRHQVMLRFLPSSHSLMCVI